MLRIQITTTNTSIRLAHSSEHYWPSFSASYRTCRTSHDHHAAPCLYACYAILGPGSICPYRS